jgi:hypothetical protein
MDEGGLEWAPAAKGEKDLICAHGICAAARRQIDAAKRLHLTFPVSYVLMTPCASTIGSGARGSFAAFGPA